MADSTIYPYGTGGHFPSNIGVINDLVTGGANNALSAEMGKKIGRIISYLDTGACVEDGLFLVDEKLNIGAKITNDGIFAMNLVTAINV